MATFDTKSLFDQAAFSDLTIKFGNREVKCHKLILCNVSEYFKAMLAGKFAESERKTIELHDDDPDAVEAMLRYIYSFEYADNAGKPALGTAAFHLNVYVVAKKYQMPTLGTKALKSVHGEIATFDKTGNPSTTRGFEILQLIMALKTYKEHDESFEKVAKKLTIAYLPALMKEKEFRASLEGPDGQGDLKLVQTAVERGHDASSRQKWILCQTCRREYYNGPVAWCTTCKKMIC
ncbi:hypothetical protein LTR37_007887 [Vermiconidia calcicola]|uniref:Uncharacterized protein n=1 Tax=Vermiconidia calcicola TaxID=1690605 RepID=A0ACC3NC96_9PEZI|nr:hypothetical protein LTR37_007887 [Vermiconidia calcicola]